MLQLTDAAAATLRDACEEEGLPADSAGVRVSGTADDSGTLSLEVTLQEEPEPTDHVSDHEVIRLFVAPEVAEPLSSLELAISDDGQEGAQLQLQEQGAGA